MERPLIDIFYFDHLNLACQYVILPNPNKGPVIFLYQFPWSLPDSINKFTLLYAQTTFITLHMADL